MTHQPPNLAREGLNHLLRRLLSISPEPTFPSVPNRPPPPPSSSASSSRHQAAGPSDRTLPSSETVKYSKTTSGNFQVSSKSKSSSFSSSSPSTDRESAEGNVLKACADGVKWKHKGKGKEEEVETLDISVRLRHLMRNVAQPVVVAVTRSNPNNQSTSSSPSPWHGATLTSFTSLSLHPYPLVAFSLRLPSRMADLLRPSSTLSSGSSTTTKSRRLTSASLCTSTTTATPMPTPTHAPTSIPLSNQNSISMNAPFSSNSNFSPLPTLTVSLLSTQNISLAQSLSKGHFDQSTIFEHGWVPFPRSTTYATTGTTAITTPSTSSLNSRPPSAKSSVGSLFCQVLTSTPLRDLCEDSLSSEPSSTLMSTTTETIGQSTQNELAHGSELFVCRVIDIYDPTISTLQDAETLQGGNKSLLYYKQAYVGPENA